MKKKISLKIAIPIISIVLLTLILLPANVIRMLNNANKKIITSHMNEHMKNYQTDLKRIEKKALSIASYCASYPFVIEAYDTFERTNDIAQSSAIIEKNFVKINNSLQENTGQPIRVHYHLPPARSFIRCWTDKRGDDLSEFRYSVKKVFLTKKATVGMEVGRAGTVIRGLVPIKDSTGNVVGSVESFFPIKDLLDKLKTSQLGEYAIFLKKETSSLSDSSYTYDKISNKSNQKYIFSTSTNNFKKGEITSQEIDKFLQDSLLISREQYVYAISRLTDFSGQEIGVIAYRFDSSAMQKMKGSIIQKIPVFVSIAILIIIALIIIILKKAILTPLKKNVAFADNIAIGNFDIELNIKQQDEIGTLANSLTSMLDALKKGVEYAQDVANGNLQTTASKTTSQSPLEIALAKMKTQLHSVISETNQVSSHLLTSSLELSNAISRISSGANEQAAASEEISASMEQMSATINQNAENSEIAKKIASRSAVGIQIGQKSFQATMDSLNEISKSITTISSIAEKTDVLAINAAIEAARAGENGKGFAIVAQEIRKLAEISQTAATLIKKVVKKSLISGQTSSNLLLEIVPQIQKTAQLVEQISNASNEQNSGISQINNAIQELTKVTQQNTEVSEEISESSNELAHQAQRLDKAMGFFNTDNLNITP